MTSSRPSSLNELFVPTTMLSSDHPVAQAWRYVEAALESLDERPDAEPSVLAARLMAASWTLKTYWRSLGF